jgi:hypothetical protein
MEEDNARKEGSMVTNLVIQKREREKVLTLKPEAFESKIAVYFSK